MTDKPQVLFGPWVEVSLVKGVGSIVEFPLMQAELSSGKQTEHVQITIFGENTKEDGIMSNQEKYRDELRDYLFTQQSVTLLDVWQASAERSAKGIAELEAEVVRLKGILDLAKNSLEWFYNEYPSGVSEAEHELIAQIDEAMKGGE